MASWGHWPVRKILRMLRFTQGESITGESRGHLCVFLLVPVSASVSGVHWLKEECLLNLQGWRIYFPWLIFLSPTNFFSSYSTLSLAPTFHFQQLRLTYTKLYHLMHAVHENKTTYQRCSSRECLCMLCFIGIIIQWYKEVAWGWFITLTAHNVRETFTLTIIWWASDRGNGKGVV